MTSKVKPVIETERIILRQLTMDDMDNLLEIFSDPEAMRYYPSTKNEEETIKWIEWNLKGYQEHGMGLWAAILKESGEFVGQVGLVVQEVDQEKEFEIGYLFLRKFWGRGLATEGAIACKEYGFNTLGVDRLISIIDPNNMPSRRVAERVGMLLEKQVVKRNKEVLIYSISKG
jgi:ribosomal-protein-alanine N-acetyltransferase